MTKIQVRFVALGDPVYLKDDIYSSSWIRNSYDFGNKGYRFVNVFEPSVEIFLCPTKYVYIDL